MDGYLVHFCASFGRHLHDQSMPCSHVTPNPLVGTALLPATHPAMHHNYGDGNSTAEKDSGLGCHNLRNGRACTPPDDYRTLWEALAAPEQSSQHLKNCRIKQILDNWTVQTNIK